MEVDDMDDLDIRELTAEDFLKAHRNPFAENIRRHGYSTIEHRESGEQVITYYSPETIARQTNKNM